MVYETSYESGRRPFLPDTKRGYWANPNDFIYAGLSLAFRLDVFSMSWFFMMESNVVAVIPIYILTLFFYIVPFLVIQSFMGQFSTSGYISAFRLTPLFKGVGFVTLALNICVLSYYSIFAMVPLVYMFASMQPTLPWSCEGFKKWATNLTEEEETNLCNLYSSAEEDEEIDANSTYSKYVNHHVPSVLYFKSLFNDINLFHFDDVEFSMSWQLILCAILVWVIVILIVYKYFNTETISQIIRYTVWTLCGLLVLFLIRFSFLPGASHVHRRIFIPKINDIVTSIASIPIYGLSAFGPGWGLFITLSSFNKFKTNIMKQSWLIGLGQMLIVIGLDLLANLSEKYFKEITEGNYYANVERVWILYLSTGSAMSHMVWANLWSILFYFMLFLAAMLLIIIQLYTILTTIFDEFVSLRERKMEVSMAFITVIAAISLYFSSNHGVTYFTALSTDTYITQAAINLLLILIVLWIYGRVRFQRDIEFMINERFSTWKINILRFVSPLGMVFALFVGLFVAYYEHLIANGIIAIFALIFIVLPWLLIPAYAIYFMRQSIGSFKTRFQRCCRPNDWYPVEPGARQRYEEAMGNMDITHQLNDITENAL